MRLLVRRYVTAEQRKTEEFGITEDDVMEIRQDISSMRFEMVDIFKQNGYKTPKKDHDSNVGEWTSYMFVLNIGQKIAGLIITFFFIAKFDFIYRFILIVIYFDTREQIIALGVKYLEYGRRGSS